MVLLEHHLQPRLISQKEGAARMGLDPAEVSRFIHGHRDVDARLAVKLAALTGTDAYYWLSLQAKYDLAREHAEPQPGAMPPAGAPPSATAPSSPEAPARLRRNTPRLRSRRDPASDGA
jgi:addiction module HigA family antidote